MTDMIEVKTAELVGPALDWAVAASEGYQPLLIPTGRAEYSVGVITTMDEGPKGFACRYSTDWAQGGPLIRKYQIEFSINEDTDEIGASLLAWRSYGKSHRTRWSKGLDHLIAACRAIVSAKLGDTVRVPAALVGGGA